MQRMKLAAMAALVAAVLLLAAATVLSMPGASATAPFGVSAGLMTQLPGYDKVASGLWPATAAGKQTSLLVVLTEQADLGGASQLPTKDAKSRYVYDALRATALRTQTPLRAWLDAQGIAYRGHYLVNMLAVEGDRSLLLALAARPDVGRLVANPTVAGIEPISAAPAPLSVPAATEWGVRFVKAPEVWNDYGVTGQGIVIGDQDTGVEWSHPALQPKYRGWDGAVVDHDYNWHDAIGATADCPDPSVPCDGYGHGTHTVGTLVGDDGVGNQVGVAPGSRWIGCRNMDDSGNGRPETYIGCFEFLLAPYPMGGDPLVDGNPDLGAHIVNNSWGCPPSEGCDLDTLQQIVEAVRAAGVLVVASAGNNGLACGSVFHPIATYDASFSVGAIDSSGALAPFSSRGPVIIDGSNRPKPDIVAPGVAVRSTVLGGGYGFMQGTSMAAPHVAGVAALLWSADPTLIGQIDDTEIILTRTAGHVSATTCGASGPEGWPNNSYGWGYVDALAAVAAVREPASVAGQASQVFCGVAEPAANTQLTFIHGATGVTTTITAVTGVISATLPPGPYTVIAAAPQSSVTLTQTMRLLGNQENTLDFTFDGFGSNCVFVPLVETPS